MTFTAPGVTVTVTPAHSVEADVVVDTHHLEAHGIPMSCNRPFPHLVRRAGFTLAEILIVVVIAGMMITLAIPRIDTTKIKADAIATIVRTTLQYAQRQAITRQHDMVVSFDTTGEKIRTFWDVDNDGTYENTERLSLRGLDVGVLFTDPAARGVSGSAISNPVSGAAIRSLNNWPTITFHRDGSASTDAEIYIKVAGHGPPWYRAVTVTEATGRVDWYRLNTTTNQWVQANQ
jgi:prepilin-type N-terminal cleavage/methylation domain-containing protein